MIKPASHFKIGLFVIIMLAAFVATAAGFGAKSVTKKTVRYHTYFNESVQGLDVGAPVKFRGVTIGAVSAIEIASDHRHVDVVADLDVPSIRKMGLTEQGPGRDEAVRFIVPPDLRAQLGSQGITGVKFLLIDYFDPVQNPAPELPFDPDPNYIPAAFSLFKSLEDSVMSAMDKLPEMSERLSGVLSKIDTMLGVLEQEGVADNVSETVKSAVALLKDARAFIRKVDDAGIPAKASSTIADLDRAVGKLSRILDDVGGERGLVASTQRATDSLGTFGKSATRATRDLEGTLRALNEAAQAIRDLAESLDRDPDMLLKGRAKKERR